MKDDSHRLPAVDASAYSRVDGCAGAPRRYGTLSVSRSERYFLSFTGFQRRCFLG